MTVFHFFNCAILTFGPHAVYYSATPLSEYDTLGTSIKAAVVYLATALVKVVEYFEFSISYAFCINFDNNITPFLVCIILQLICLATFLKVSESDSFDPYQEFLKALIGFIDVAGLYFALTQLTHRNISQNHKFQAVGLGWAFADSVLHRLAPLWVGARGLEFTWDYILQGLEANANLVGSFMLKAFSFVLSKIDTVFRSILKHLVGNVLLEFGCSFSSILVRMMKHFVCVGNVLLVKTQQFVCSL
ncbi:transmembrane protein 147 isoform X1 [Abrus precatorius]|uniref:BOS complex subunit TMEM147 n=1 Tax=Abrus precatorius TaxID=3816 RepID=A0A8B8LHS0_ABRPR|nr:transmembrane protein 147 isoform X1 [Abrus precatorius]